jgi:uncharacterized RDD family membrane protein YckC
MLTSGICCEVDMDGEREGDVIDSRADADQPVSVGARTRRGVLARLGLVAVAACLLDLEFALGLGSSDWALVVGPVVFLVLSLLMLAGTAELTIAGHELRRRGWLSRPGREPSLVMELGPQVQIVHESRLVWRVRPNGRSLGAWQARGLSGAMERAGVRVNDWRGDWARRHRLLDILGGLALYGGLAGIIAMPILGSQGSLFRAAAFTCSGAILLGLAIDYLPWSMRKTPAHDGWPPLSAGGAGSELAQQTQAGPAPGLEFGGFWLRVLAYLIDVSLLGIVGLALSSALGTVGQAIGGLIFIAYFTGLWGLTGQTIGMMLLGLHVVRDVDGGKISWGNAVLRFIGLLVAFACIWIGVIWVAFDSRKQGWQDRIGGTVVVRNVGDGNTNESTRRPNVRLAATAGVIMSFVAAAAASGSSNTPVQTFFSTLWPLLTGALVAIAFVLVINRRSSQTRDL